MENRCFNCKYYKYSNYFEAEVICSLRGRVHFSIGDSNHKWVCDKYEKDSE